MAGFNNFNKGKRKLLEKKGDTFTGIMVMLLIGVILLILLLGAMKAKEREILTDCRFTALAAQSVAAEYYAKGDAGVNRTWTVSGGQTQSPMKEIAELSGVDSKKLEKVLLKVTIKDYEVSEVCYRDEWFQCIMDPVKGTYDIKSGAGKEEKRKDSGK